MQQVYFDVSVRRGITHIPVRLYIDLCSFCNIRKLVEHGLGKLIQRAFVIVYMFFAAGIVPFCPFFV